MNNDTSTPTGSSDSALPSLKFVQQELRRIPIAARIRLNQLGFRADLEQELHLAYYLKIKERPTPAALKRAIHAAGERLRYREVVRRAKYEVPEELAGSNITSSCTGLVQPMTQLIIDFMRRRAFGPAKPTNKS